MAVDDVYEVAIVGQQTGSTIVNTLHYRTTVSVGAKFDEMAALAEETLNTVIPSLAALCSDTLSWSVIRVRDIANPLLGFDRAISASGVGTGEAMPKQISALILWKTGFIGRARTGRMYLPAVEEVQWDGEAWVSAYLTAVTAFAGAVNALALSDFPDTGDEFEWQQVVYSAVLGTPADVISFGISPNPATQRRRKSGVGS